MQCIHGASVKSTVKQVTTTTFLILSLLVFSHYLLCAAKKTSTLSSARQARSKLILAAGDAKNIDSKLPNFPPKSIFGESQPAKTAGKLTIPQIEQSLRGAGGEKK